MIEIDVTIDNSVGAFTVHLGGVAEFSGSSLDTQVTANAYLNGMQMTPLDGSTGGCYDDMYTCDTTGPAPYNTFLGNIRVETLFPTSNVSVTWTPLASTNWVEVSEVNMDSDVSYNSQASTGTDTFGHGSLVSTPATIFAINVVSCARKSDVKNLTYRNKLTSGATSVNGVTADLATVYTYSSDMYLVDPHTSAAWDATTVNATVFGYERF